jgi:hypothetical protein
VTENSINRFGLNTGIFFINFNFISDRLYLSLVESSVYSLEIATKPFYGNTESLIIEFDTSDRQKYYSFIN